MQGVAGKFVSVFMSVVLAVGLCPGLAYAGDDAAAAADDSRPQVEYALQASTESAESDAAVDTSAAEAAVQAVAKRVQGLILGTQSFNEDPAEIPASTEALTLGEEKSVSVPSSGVQWLVFTPETAGLYVFEARGDNVDSYGALYIEDAGVLTRLTSNDDGGNGNHFKIVYDLEAQTTYYLACSMYEEGSADYQVSVALLDANDLTNYSLSYSEFATYTGEGMTAERLGLSLVNSYDEEADPLVYGEDYTVVSWVNEDYEGMAEEDLPEGAVVSGTDLAQIRERGRYYVTLGPVAETSYYGELTFSFVIPNENDLSYASITNVRTRYFASQTVELAPIVYAVDGTELTEGTHYTVSLEYEADDEWQTVETVSDPGYYRLLIESTEDGGYVGSGSWGFDVAEGAWTTASSWSNYADVPAGQVQAIVAGGSAA